MHYLNLPSLLKSTLIASYILYSQTFPEQYAEIYEDLVNFTVVIVISSFSISQTPVTEKSVVFPSLINLFSTLPTVVIENSSDDFIFIFIKYVKTNMYLCSSHYSI